MTVKELIAELEKIDDKNLDVEIITESRKVKPMDVYFKEEHFYKNGTLHKGVIMYGDY